MLQLAAGLACLLLLSWALGWAGLLNRVSAWGLCGLGWLLLAAPLARCWRSRRAAGDDATPGVAWTWLLAVPPAALLLVAASCPPGTLWPSEAFAYDVTTYHLQLPREWLEAGRMQGLRHNAFSYLPNLGEAGYTLVGALHGRMYDGIYTAQFLHAGAALLAAGAVGRVTARVAGGLAGGFAAALLLATPWTLITGSLAYDEMFTLAFGAAALLAVLAPQRLTWRYAALAGFLAGATTLAKLTAGPMLALPLGLVLLLRLAPAAGERPRWVRAAGSAAVAALAGALTLAPYLARNTSWTGNPVFPLATASLGRGHWTAEEAARFERGTAPHGTAAERVRALGRRWLVNRGYGAVGGGSGAVERGASGVAGFDDAGVQGVPLLWLLALGGAAAGLAWPAARRLTLAMILTLTVQVVVWLTATHLQSRFLIPSLIPGCVLAGVGAGRLAAWAGEARLRLWGIGAAAMVAVLWINGLTLLREGTRTFPLTDAGGRPTGRTAHVPLWLVADSLPRYDRLADPPPDKAMFRLPINALAPSNTKAPRVKVLLVGDVGALLYLRPPVEYHTAFDHSPLGDLLRQYEHEAPIVTRALSLRGITHVWVGWSELNRLHGYYGHDADVTETSMRRLAAQARWRVVADQSPYATLFELPDHTPDAPPLTTAPVESP